MKRKTFILTESTIQKINEIKEKLSYKHEIDVVVHAVNELYKSEFENYTAIAKAKLLQKPTLDEKAQKEVELQIKTKKAKTDRLIIEGEATCNTLNGTVEDNFCYWNSYELRNDGTEEITSERQSIAHVGLAEIENQYQYMGEKVSLTEYNNKKNALQSSKNIAR
jgi:hypothetical protein